MAKNGQKKRIYSQGKTPRLIADAAKKGIVPIRRTIHPSSYELFNYITEQIHHPFLDTDVRKFTAQSATVTIIGASNIKARTLRNGPTSEEILKIVPDTKRELAVKIGSIGVFGNESVKPKLSFKLISEEIHNERDDIINAYSRQSHGLHINEFEYESGWNPHCTVAILGLHAVSHFKKQREQDRINRVIHELGPDQFMLLSPVTVPPMKPAV